MLIGFRPISPAVFAVARSDRIQRVGLRVREYSPRKVAMHSAPICESSLAEVALDYGRRAGHWTVWPFDSGRTRNP